MLLAVLVAPFAHAANTITCPAALERAMRTRAAGTTFDARARTLEALPFYTLPTVRAEAGLSSAEHLNILTQDVGRFDAFTALVHVDYPLLDAGAERRRNSAIAFERRR
jgi:hypothetical protein